MAWPLYWRGSASAMGRALPPKCAFGANGAHALPRVTAGRSTVEVPPAAGRPHLYRLANPCRFAPHAPARPRPLDLGLGDAVHTDRFRETPRSLTTRHTALRHSSRRRIGKRYVRGCAMCMCLCVYTRFMIAIPMENIACLSGRRYSVIYIIHIIIYGPSLSTVG